MLPQRPNILSGCHLLIAAYVLLAACAAVFMARRLGAADPPSSARLSEVRRIAHDALARRLNEPSGAASATRPAAGALTLDLRLRDAVITARPLGVDDGGGPWSLVTISTVDASGQVISQQSERVAFYRPHGQWTVSRILIDGHED